MMSLSECWRQMRDVINQTCDVGHACGSRGSSLRRPAPCNAPVVCKQSSPSIRSSVSPRTTLVISGTLLDIRCRGTICRRLGPSFPVDTHACAVLRKRTHTLHSRNKRVVDREIREVPSFFVKRNVTVNILSQIVRYFENTVYQF